MLQVCGIHLTYVRLVSKLDLLKRNVAILPNEEQMELMRHTCNILNTNSFEVVVTASRDKDRTTSLRGLYPMGAFQNHCCVPNTRHHFDDQQRLHVSAVLPIAAGEEITMSYTDLLWDTLTRRRFLKVTKRFACNCNRCSDPQVRQHCDNSLGQKFMWNTLPVSFRNLALSLAHFFARETIVRGTCYPAILSIVSHLGPVTSARPV